MIVKLTIGKMKSSRLSSSCFQYSSTDDFSVTVKVRNRYLSFGSNLYFKLILIDEFLASAKYRYFLDRVQLLRQRLVRHGYAVPRLKSSLSNII
jgi:hypothetical protein